MVSPVRRGPPFVLLVALCLISVVLETMAVRSQTVPDPPTTVTIDGREAVAGDVLVRFASAPVAAASQQVLGRQVDAVENVAVGRRGLRRFRSRRFDIDTLLAFFRAQPGIVFAEPNYIVRTTVVPDDPEFPSLWGLLNLGQRVGGKYGTPGADIGAVAAWGVSTGSRENVVGVIDTGIDYMHPDLAANVWSAPIPFNVTIGGVTITCPAGSHGFNAIPRPRTCDPMGESTHGTHVSGTIGAVGNNGIGVTGVNWTASIIAGKFLNAGGTGTISDAVDTIDFMIQAKTAFAAGSGANIRVLSNSWGGSEFSQALEDAIADADAHDMLFVAAAGNNGRNIDSSPFYPASYSVPNVVAVAATNNRDFMASFSNYGPIGVDLAAPGVEILSTQIGGHYDYMDGTSMATPHVAGAAALVLATCALDTPGLKNALLSSVDVLGSLTDLVATGGRLNLDRAVRTCDPDAIPAPPTALVALGGTGEVTLRWRASGGARTYTVKRSLQSGGPYTAVATEVTSNDYIDSGLTNGVTYYYVVSAVNSFGESADSPEASATPLPPVPRPPQGLNATPGDARVSLTWLPSVHADSYRVWRSAIRSGPYISVGEVRDSTFTDVTVTNGIKYFYAVSALNIAGEGHASNKEGAVPAPVPGAPVDVTAAPGEARKAIDLSWSASPWATAYRVKRSLTSGGPYAGIAHLTTLNLTDTAGASGRRYFYVITAVNGSGTSGPSVEVSAVSK
jgi:subtilisin family serine protease